MSTTAMLTMINQLWVVLVLTTGIPGNIYCCYQYLTNNRLRRRTSCQYLAAIAVADLFFLFTLSLTLLRAVGLPADSLPIICETTTFLVYVTNIASAWLITAYTLERAMAVRYPNLTESRSSWRIRRVRIRVLVISGLAAAINAWVPIVTQPGINVVKPEGRNSQGASPQSFNASAASGGQMGHAEETDAYNMSVCTVKQHLLPFYDKANIIDTIISFILPIMLIIPANSYIMLSVCATRRHHSLVVLKDVTSPDPLLESVRTDTRVDTRGHGSITSRSTVNNRSMAGSAGGPKRYSVATGATRGIYRPPGAGSTPGASILRNPNCATGSSRAVQRSRTGSKSSWSFLRSSGATVGVRWSLGNQLTPTSRQHRPSAEETTLSEQQFRAHRRITKLERRLTVLLVTISLLYVVLNAPSHVGRILLTFGVSPNEVTWSLCYNLYYAQYAANCWAFAVFSQRWSCLHKDEQFYYNR